MEYDKDIGKFVTLAFYYLKDTDQKLITFMGMLGVDEEGFLVFTNVKDESKKKRVNPTEIKVVGYSVEPVEVHHD